MKKNIMIPVLIILSLNSFFAENLKQIKIGYEGHIYESSLFVAKEKGLFKNGGFDAVFLKYDTGKLQNALEKKEVDFVLLNPLSVKNYENIKFAGVVSLSRIFFITKKSSDIKSILHLKNKKIGIDDKKEVNKTISSFAFRKAEIDQKNNIKIISIQTNDLKKNLDEGKVTVILFSNEDSFLSFDSKKYRKVLNLTSDDIFRFSLPYFITVRADYENKKEEIIIPVLKILNMANEIIANENEDAFNILANSKYLKVKIADKNILNDYGWFPATHKEIEKIKNYYEAREKSGISNSIDYKNFIKTGFLEIKKDVLSINENIEYNVLEDCCKVD